LSFFFATLAKKPNMKQNTPIIYLDYNSTTPIDNRVLETMILYLNPNFANASSSHKFGLESNQAVFEARKKIANLISAEDNEIVFTSGATESINLAVKGIALANLDKGKHIITLQTEHKAGLDVCNFLATIGFEIEFLPVESDGILDISRLKKAIREDTILISIMYANNEIGVIQPIEQIAKIAKENNILFFSDATQAFAKIPINVKELGIDALAFSGHKFYAPKGIGGLFIKKGVKCQALLHGGGHERGLRSGTLNVPAIVALGKACEIAQAEMSQTQTYVEELRNFLEQELLKINGTRVNGSQIHRLFNTTNIQFENIDGDALIKALDYICVSKGSACTSVSVEPSHVLKAIGLSDDEAYQSIRFSLGKYNKKAELEETIEKIKLIITDFRNMLF
jgi:cysteine desulfurase